MIRFCAGCGKVIDENVPGDRGSTHGMCEACHTGMAEESAKLANQAPPAPKKPTAPAKA